VAKAPVLPEAFVDGLRRPSYCVPRKCYQSGCVPDPLAIEDDLMSRRTCIALVWLGWCFVTVATPVVGGDWPQILGPNRNGIAENEALADSWPDGGPKTLWPKKVGSGLAGVAVAEGKAVLFHRIGDQELIEALDPMTGESLWKTDFPTSYVPSYTSDNGPRCVPIIHKGRVYVFGAQGGLRCVNLKDGEKVWERNTHQEFNAPEGYFGAGSSPIIEGNRILVNVGAAREGAGIVAFDLDSGQPLWKVTQEQASYSSPVAVTIGDVRHVIFVTRMQVVSIDPESGKIRFQFPFGQRGPTVNAASPLVIDDHLFVSASYGIGAAFARIGPDQADVLWRSDDILSSQYTTCIAHAGNLYGIDGRQDVGGARLRSFDPKTQKVHWTVESFGYATLIKADGKLLIFKTDGELVLAELNADQYTELARTRLFNAETRALPALADGRLYVRDVDTLKCVELGK
jgi:outer membrane protein assembly factor BamB